MQQINSNTLKIDIAIEDKPFLVDNLKISEKTACLSFFYKNKNQENTQFLAYLDQNQINSFFKTKEKLILKQVFIDNPTLLTNDFENIEISESVIWFENIDFVLKCKGKVNFNKTIFISEQINFSNWQIGGLCQMTNTKFICKKMQMNNSKFEKGLNFKYSEFYTDFVEFEKIKVEAEEVNFSNITFDNSNVSFAHSYFGKARKMFSNTNFGQGFVDFSHIDFGNGDVIFERTNFGYGNVSFRSSNFGIGTVDFRRAEFGDGEKDFTNVNFNDGNVKFINALFRNGKINFRFANFGNGNIDFHYSQFGDCSFLFDHINSNNGTIDFRGAEFKKANISLIDLRFGDGNIIFESFQQQSGSFTIKDAFFGRGTISFENSSCSNVQLLIENVDFGAGSVFFTNAEFKSIVFRHTQVNGYFDLRVKKCEVIDFANTVISGVLDLKPIDYLNVGQIYFQGARLLGRIYIDWLRSNIKQIISSQNSSNHQKAVQFRILKENYHNIGEYEYEDFAYVEFKRFEAKDKLDKIKNKPFRKRLIIRVKHWFEWLILDKMGEYATNPIRVLASMLVVYILFSLIFLVIGYLHPQNHAIVSSLFPSDSPQVLNITARSFYHSIVTFLTIGYGDYYPTGIIRVLSGLEGFIGLFLMSYFTVAFVRKILR